MSNIQMTQKEYESRIDKIRLCGANRGPHDYIPIEWKSGEGVEFVTTLICRICLNRVRVETLYEHFIEARV